VCRYFIKITSGETDVIEELGIVDENLSNVSKRGGGVGLPIPLSNEEAAAAAAASSSQGGAPGANSHDVEMITADNVVAPGSSSSSKSYRRNAGGKNSSLRLTEIVTEKKGEGGTDGGAGGISDASGKFPMM